MKKTKNIQIILTILIYMLVGCNEKKEKNLNEYGEYLRLLQNTSTGNCAVIEKTASDDGNFIYTATASVVASGRCRESNFFTFLTNAEEAKTKSDSYYNGMTLVYNNYADCSELVKTAVTSRDLTTASSIIEGAQTSSTGCIKVVPKVYYCKDSASLSSLSSKYWYLSISNAKSDMRTSYNSTVSINLFANKTLDLKYEDVPIGNLRIASTAEVTLFEGAESNSLISAVAQDAACFKKVILGNASLKTAYAKIPTLQEFFKEEINVSDRKSVTETITPNLICRYGTNVSELPANGTSPAIGVCPTTYPVF